MRAAAMRASAVPAAPRPRSWCHPAGVASVLVTRSPGDGRRAGRGRPGGRAGGRFPRRRGRSRGSGCGGCAGGIRGCGWCSRSRPGSCGRRLRPRRAGARAGARSAGSVPKLLSSPLRASVVAVRAVARSAALPGGRRRPASHCVPCSRPPLKAAAISSMPSAVSATGSIPRRPPELRDGHGGIGGEHGLGRAHALAVAVAADLRVVRVEGEAGAQAPDAEIAHPGRQRGGTALRLAVPGGDPQAQVVGLLAVAVADEPDLIGPEARDERRKMTADDLVHRIRCREQLGAQPRRVARPAAAGRARHLGRGPGARASRSGRERRAG